MNPDALKRLLSLKAADADTRVHDDSRPPWGGVYAAGGDQFKALQALQARAYAEYGSTNALYPAVWPSVTAMSQEIVRWCIGLANGGCDGDGDSDGGDACGILTSGGTESILISLLAHREEAVARGIAEPEVVCSSTAHGAVAKAGFYFKLKVVLVHPDPVTMRLTRAAVAKVCTPSTCCIFASAPSFPHGVVDDLRGLGSLALELGCGLHMDNCLGGVLLQHLQQEGKLKPGGHAAAAAQLGLQLPGLTAISMDVHKYGYASKGASVVLFASPELRRRSFKPVGPVPGGQYTGGPYITPTLQGARGGGAIAAAWVTVAAMGNVEYRAAATRLHTAFETVQAAVKNTPGVELVGDAELAVIAMRPCGSAAAEGQIGVTVFAEGMKSRGWAFFSGLNPFAASLCLGEQHVNAVEHFAVDLKAALAEAHAAASDAGDETAAAGSGGGGGEDGSVAGPYQSGGILNEAVLNQMLVAYVESGLDTPVEGLPSAKL